MLTLTLRRRLSALAAALVAACLTVLMSAGPAAAAWTDTGGNGNSNSNSNGGGNVSSGSSTFSCGRSIGLVPSALYIRLAGRWVRWWDAPYGYCTGSSGSGNLSYSYTGYAELCPTGFLVYRFYGTVNNPTIAVTRSQTNQTQWCAPESTYAFPANTPLDAGVDAGAPWKTTVGVNASQQNDGASNIYYFRNDAGLLAPSYPTQVTGSCTSAQTGNSMVNWFNTTASPAEQIALRAALGYDYWVASAGGRYPATGLAEAGLSTASGYRFSWGAWLADTSVAPVADPNGDAFYLTDFTWESRSCASPLQFMSNTDTATQDRVVIGTCYVPTVRKRTQMLSSSGQYVWSWNALTRSTNSTQGDGERMSNLYRNTQYTPGGAGGDSLDASVTGLSADQQTALVTGWRNAMVANYRAWAAAGLQTAAGAQVVPVNPYAGEADASLIGKTTAIDVNAAAETLYNAARCRVGTSVRFDLPQPQDAPELGGTVNLNVTDVDVMQVSATTAQVKVSAGAMTCQGGTGCPDTVALKSLSWTGTLTGTNGYKICATTNISKRIPTSCDGVYTTGAGASTSGIQRSQTFTVRFAHPTDTSQAVVVSLSNLKGTYTQQITTTGFQIKGVSPVTGSSYSIDTGPLTAKITKSLTVTASATPKALTPTGTGYKVTFPVIGAVQVPVTR